jgi:benzodiazapine receptor
MNYRWVVFLMLNFGALALGSLLMGGGLTSSWFANLNQAPWNPPGWLFGFAWTTIMISFAFYMSVLLGKLKKWKGVFILYLLQLCLNIAWNPTFFMFENAGLALIIISLLTVLIGYFLVRYAKTLGYYSLLILPYFLWLLVATSLNLYIFLAN